MIQFKKTLQSLGVALLFPSLAFAATGDGSMTPTSYKIPIIKVSISKADFTEEQALYECPAGTIAGCMVDVADATALAAISTAARNVSIRVGTYHVLNISTCPAGSSGTNKTVVKVTGQVTVGGIVYSTQTVGDAGIGIASTAEETQIDTLGCTNLTIYPATPITITEGGSQALTVNVNLSNVLYTQAAVSPGMGGCKAPAAGSSRGVCTNLPFMIPYLGTGTVTTEQYLIANSSTDTASSLTAANANGQVLLAVDPDGKVFYASTLPYYSDTSISTSSTTGGGNGMQYGLSRLDMNNPELGMNFSYSSTASTVSFLTGGSNDTSGFGVNGFQRVTHTGVTAPRTGGTSWYYKAFKQ